MRVRTRTVAALFSVIAAMGQPQTALSDAFDVATVKPTPPDWRGGRFIMMQTAHQFVARDHTLKTLIAAAYNLNPQTILAGPPWVDSDHYDILAKAPGEVRPSLSLQMSMLRNLLSERFQLSFHRETKELQHFVLTVTKSGPRMQESTTSPDATPEGPPPLVLRVFPQEIQLPGRNATMAELASVMQRAAVNLPVIDRTGLSGRYDFDLEWARDDVKAPDTNAKPGLFSAIQEQMGLKLEAMKGPIQVMVIDRAQHPSEN